MCAEKRSRGPEMCIADEMRAAIIDLAGPKDWIDTRQRWLERAARRAGISFRAAKALYYGETPDPRSSVVEKIRAALKQHKEKVGERARGEYAIVKKHAGHLLDAHSHRPHPDRADVAALRARASLDRIKNSSMDRE